MNSRQRFVFRRIATTSLALLVLMGACGGDDNIPFSGTTGTLATAPATTSNTLTDPSPQPRMERPSTGIPRNDTPMEAPLSTPIPSTDSPEGLRIVFQSNRDGNYEIYTMNADGTLVTRLTHNQWDDANPSFSPDETKIVFSTYHDGRYSEIYLMNEDGSDQTNLTNNPTSHDFDPRWSPDGKKIVFKSDRESTGGTYEIYIFNFDGSGLHRLTSNLEYSWAPSWSPDGTKIAFSMGQGPVPAEIFVIDIDGTEQIRLTDNSAVDGVARWSPDGKKIAFESDRHGNREIYVMSSDGTGQTRLTNDPADDIQPSWSPDGGTIVFQSNRSGNYDLYKMHSDGSDVVRLTDNPGHDGSPSWSP